MATVSEILAERLNSGDYIPEEVLRVTGNTDGVTEELYTNAVLDSLGTSYPFLTGKLERTNDAQIPDYSKVISLIGLKDDPGVKDSVPGARTALEKFVEDYPKEWKDWKKSVMKNTGMGERGWKTVRKIWEQTSIDKMHDDIRKARNEIADEDGFRAWLARLVAPRAVKAVREGRDPEPQEVAGDLFENAAYLAPAGYMAAPLKAGLRMVPKIGRGVSSALGTAASQFVAPSAVFAVDKRLGNETTWHDPVIGGLTNMGVNRVLGPMIGKGVSVLENRVGRAPIPPSVRKLLEGAESQTDLAQNTVNKASDLLNFVDKTPNEKLLLDAIRYGKRPPNSRAVDEAQTILEIAEAARSPKAQNTVQGFLAKPELANKFVNNPEGIVANAVNAARGVGQWNPEVASEAVTEAMKKEGRESFLRYNSILEKNPELMSMFVGDAGPGMGDVLISYATNQYGNSNKRTGKVAGSAIGIDVASLKKEQEAERSKSKAASAILDIQNNNQGLTERDTRFLKDISERPSIVQYGHPTDPEGFKLWMLQRGHDLLSGTAASRPTWEVK